LEGRLTMVGSSLPILNHLWRDSF